MHKRQRGVTFIGWLFLLIPLAVCVYAAIRLAPLYLNHAKVASAIEQVAAEARNDEVINPVMLRNSLEKRLDIEGVEFPNVKDIRIARAGEGWFIQATYERTAPLFGGIQLLVSFNKREEIQ